MGRRGIAYGAYPPEAGADGPALLLRFPCRRSCSGVTVREVGEAPDLLDSFKASALAGDHFAGTHRFAVATSKNAYVSIQPKPPLSFTPSRSTIRSPIAVRLGGNKLSQGRRSESGPVTKPSAIITQRRLRLLLSFRLRRPIAGRRRFP